jgi:hypothetical protein
MNADGGGQRRLTRITEHNTGPAWLSDGRKIVFSSWHGPWDFEVYVMNADGSGQRLWASFVAVFVCRKSVECSEQVIESVGEPCVDSVLFRRQRVSSPLGECHREFSSIPVRFS